MFINKWAFCGLIFNDTMFRWKKYIWADVNRNVWGGQLVTMRLMERGQFLLTGIEALKEENYGLR